jgi:hypothetical protein
MSAKSKITLSCDGDGLTVCDAKITVVTSRSWKARQQAAGNGWTTRRAEGPRGGQYNEDFCPEHRRKP